MTNDETVPMTLGERLKKYISGERRQKVVAATWLEAMIAGGHDWSPAHVESQLSRCLGDQVSAIKFFFGDRVRGLAFVEALGVPVPDHEVIFQLAEEALTRNGERPTKLYLDLIPWSGKIETKKLFDAVRTSIVEPRPLKPCVLLVTLEQYDELPRSFDREKDWLDVQCIDADNAYEKLDPHALVASPVPFDPDRWVAIGLDATGALIFEPNDALVRFARSGTLAIPVGEFDLERYVSIENLPPARVPKGAVERRKWMTMLRTEAVAVEVDPDPRVRLSTARSLGVTAVATQRDRIEHELALAIASLPLSSAKLATKDELQGFLSKAARFPHPETLLRVGDELHLINPTKAPETIAPTIIVHRIAAKQTALRRLEHLVSEWDDSQRDADSFLWNAMEQLGDGADDHLALLHARATLVRTSAWKRDEALVRLPVPDALDALVRIVASDPPPARLRLQNRALVLRSTLPDWARGAVAAFEEPDRDVLLFTHSPFASVVVDRARPLGFVRDEQASEYGNRTNFVVGKDTPDEREWIESLETFLAKRSYPRGIPHIQVRPYEVAAHLWTEADNQLALMWTFLRQVRSRTFVQRYDGEAIVRVSKGLGIQLSGMTTKTPAPATTAIVDTNEREHGYGSGITHSITHDLDLGVSGYRSLTAHVPLPLTLQSGDTRLRVSMIASPLLGLSAELGAFGDGKSDDYSSDDD